jgi:hypothetical protein
MDNVLDHKIQRHDRRLVERLKETDEKTVKEQSGEGPCYKPNAGYTGMKVLHNVPAVYDVLPARIRALRNKDQGWQNVLQ